MPDLEDELRTLLHSRADEVHPAITGAAVRSAAEQRRSRLILPLAAAALVAVVAISLTFVLHRASSRRLQPGGATTTPSVSVLPDPPRSPTTSPTRTPNQTPTAAPRASRLPSSVPTAHPDGPLGTPRSSIPVTSPIRLSGTTGPS